MRLTPTQWSEVCHGERVVLESTEGVIDCGVAYVDSISTRIYAATLSGDPLGAQMSTYYEGEVRRVWSIEP